MRLCAVSVDLDEIPNYFAIHGHSVGTDTPVTAVYDVAVPRLLGLAKGQRIPLTFFAVGTDVLRAQAAQLLRGAHQAGHEIANHTKSHRYDLVRLPREELCAEIQGGIRILKEAIGEAPVGARAPGYTVSDEYFRVLEELGVQYDSSVFPCPTYWVAKAAKVLAIRAQGRRSQSIVDTPAVLAAPTGPYRVGTPYWRRGVGLLELPIQVTRGLRLPFLGTSLTLAGPTGARVLARMCVGEPLVNLELHGLDVLGKGDGLEGLEGHQTDVRITVERKLETLQGVIEELRDAGYKFVTLGEAARVFAPAGHAAGAALRSP